MFPSIEGQHRLLVAQEGPLLTAILFNDFLKQVVPQIGSHSIDLMATGVAYIHAYLTDVEDIKLNTGIVGDALE